MIKIILLSLTLFVTGCAHMRIPGQTVADRTLRKDVYRYLKIYERSRGGGRPLKIVDTRFLERDGNTVKELWLVSRKGQLIRYLVVLIPSPTGTNFSVSLFQN